MSKKLIVAVDLDGVLADFSKGWQGSDVIGDPLPGAVAFTHELRQLGYEIWITSCRCSPSTYVRLTGIWETDEYLAGPTLSWLKKHRFCYDYLYQGRGKPLASLYIDDNAYRCTPSSDPNAFSNALGMLLAMESAGVGQYPAFVQSFEDSPNQTGTCLTSPGKVAS